MVFCEPLCNFAIRHNRFIHSHLLVQRDSSVNDSYSANMSALPIIMFEMPTSNSNKSRHRELYTSEAARSFIANDSTNHSKLSN